MKNIDSIMIAGYPRSGTTWFSNLFNSHSDTAYRHEILGRGYTDIPSDIFNALKDNHGLSEVEKEKLTDAILKAKVATDRPPFFKKNHHLISNPRLHHYLWLTTKSIPFLSPVYSAIYTPLKSKQTIILIKETRSTVQLDSIIKGINPSHLIFLFRHPYAVIASHIRGQKNGAMQKMTVESKKQWIKANKKSNFTLLKTMTEESILKLNDNELLALKWSTHNFDFLEYNNIFKQSIFVNYDAFIKDKEKNTLKLFSNVNLTYSDQTDDFIKVSSNTDKKKLSILEKDSSNEFYSVYQDKNYNAESWKEIISDKDIKSIDRLTSDILSQLINLSTIQ